MRAVKKQLGPVAEEEKGALFEGWDVHPPQGLPPRRGACTTTSSTGRRASAGGVEVDFLLRRGRELLALEVKTARTVLAVVAPEPEGDR